MTKTGTVGHIVFSASDYEKSKQFYTFLLVDGLGFHTTMDESYCMMYSLHGYSICLMPGNKTPPHHKNNPGLHHLALLSETREEVDELYHKVVGFYAANGGDGMGKILDAPKAYPEYTPAYYAVFFTDPDGIKLEFAYR